MHNNNNNNDNNDNSRNQFVLLHYQLSLDQVKSLGLKTCNASRSGVSLLQFLYYNTTGQALTILPHNL